jgi:hypothetical protein
MWHPVLQSMLLNTVLYSIFLRSLHASPPPPPMRGRGDTTVKLTLNGRSARFWRTNERHLPGSRVVEKFVYIQNMQDGLIQLACLEQAILNLTSPRVYQFSKGAAGDHLADLNKLFFGYSILGESVFWPV